MPLIKLAMSCFLDIDGTIVHTDTEEPLPGAVKAINELYEKGAMIVLTTLRGDGYAEAGYGVRFSRTNTIKMLKRIGLKYHHIIWNCPSPRIVINDDGAKAVNHPKNSAWPE
jgi:hypothetical protein